MHQILALPVAQSLLSPEPALQWLSANANDCHAHGIRSAWRLHGAELQKWV